MNSAPDNDTLHRLVSHDEIRQLAARYCWALDTLNRELLSHVFIAEATASLGRGTQNGFDEIWSWIHGVLSQLDASQHLIGSQLIDLAPDGRSATSRCHFHAQHVRASAGDDTQYIVSGGVEYKFCENWLVRPNVSYTINNSNIAINDYDRVVVGIDVTMQF